MYNVYCIHYIILYYYIIILYYITLYYITEYYIKLREYDLREHCGTFDNGILEEYEWDYDLTLLDFIEVDIND